MFLLLLYFSLALPSETAGMFSAIMLLIAPRYNITECSEKLSILQVILRYFNTNAVIYQIVTTEFMEIQY